MNNKIKIKSADDKDIPVYIYEPSIERIGAIVLIQEIFGVNDHIKNVAERFFRELRADRIWEGTSEIQRIIIANSLYKRGLKNLI